MPVLALESALPLETSGEHGASDQTGPHYTEKRTSDGPKPSVLSSLSALSTFTFLTPDTSYYMETTPASLKDGALAGTATEPSTPFSSISMLSSNLLDMSAALQPVTYQSRTIQPTSPPEAYMMQDTVFFCPFSSLNTLEFFSQTPTTLSQQENSENLERDGTPRTPPEPSHAYGLNRRQLSEVGQKASLKMNSSITPSKVTSPDGPRFNAPLTSTNNPSTIPKPRPYQSHLHPLPSIYHPHCLAKDKLQHWIPANPIKRPASGAIPMAVSEQALNRILEVIGASWADSMKELYGNGLLIYHIYCDLNGPIPEYEHCPISGTLLLSFLSSCAGGIAGSTLTNYAASIKAWHILHSQPWNIHQDELRLTLQGAARYAPNHSKQDKRLPMTVKDLKII